MISNDRFFEHLACCVLRHGILCFFLNGCKLEVFSNLESTGHFRPSRPGIVKHSIGLPVTCLNPQETMLKILCIE